MTADAETYRKKLLIQVCTKGRLIIVYCGDDPNKKETAREANQIAKMPLYDRHRILRFIHVKPLNLEDWR